MLHNTQTLSCNRLVLIIPLSPLISRSGRLAFDVVCWYLLESYLHTICQYILCIQGKCRNMPVRLQEVKKLRWICHPECQWLGICIPLLQWTDTTLQSCGPTSKLRDVITKGSKYLSYKLHGKSTSVNIKLCQNMLRTESEMLAFETMNNQLLKKYENCNTFVTSLQQHTCMTLCMMAATLARSTVSLCARSVGVSSGR